MSSLTRSTAWAALQSHYEAMRQAHMRDLFAADPDRFAKFSLRFDDLLLDYSKNRFSVVLLVLLVNLARQADLRGWIDRMFGGERINFTEDRAVLHVALRNRSNRPIYVDGVDVMPSVHAVLAQMREFTGAVRSGAWRGYTGKALTDVVNIGIGGSDLGPVMVTEALKPYGRDGLRPHFVSNIDGTHISETLRRLEPETTQNKKTTKTNNTQKTLTNTHSAHTKKMARAKDEAAVAKHFVTLSTN